MMKNSPAALKRQRDGAALVPVSVSSQAFERSPAFSMGFSMRLVHSPVQHTRASQRAFLHSDCSRAAGQGSHPPRLSTAGLQVFLGGSQVYCVLPFLAALLYFLHIRSQYTRNLQRIFRWLLETHLSHHSPAWWHYLQKVSADFQCVMFSGALTRSLLSWGSIYHQACLLLFTYSENECSSRSDGPWRSPRPATPLRSSQGSCVETCRKQLLGKGLLTLLLSSVVETSCQRSGHTALELPWSDRGQAGTNTGCSMTIPEGMHWLKKAKEFGKPLFENTWINTSHYREGVLVSKRALR